MPRKNTIKQGINQCLKNNLRLDICTGNQIIDEQFQILHSSNDNDEILVLGRARRLLELILIEYLRLTYVRKSNGPDMSAGRIKRGVEARRRNYVVDEILIKAGVKPGKIPDLHDIIHKQIRILSEVPQILVSLCHRVRINGNRALHYTPPKLQKYSPSELQDVKLWIAEIAKRLLQDPKDISIYTQSLRPPYAEMYQWFHEKWCAQMALQPGEKQKLTSTDTLDILLRSMMQGSAPAWMDVLEKYDRHSDLLEDLQKDEANILRQLRNMGLLKTDGKYLFTPSRSKKVWPSDRGNILLALKRRKQYNSTTSKFITEVLSEMETLLDDESKKAILSECSKPHDRDFVYQHEDDLRDLRNMYFITHDKPLLAHSDKVFLTDMGYYILGQYEKD